MCLWTCKSNLFIAYYGIVTEKISCEFLGFSVYNLTNTDTYRLKKSSFPQHSPFVNRLFHLTISIKNVANCATRE